MSTMTEVDVEVCPGTPTQLYEILQKLFGIGDWDESSGKPYWKFRQAEVAKIKNVLKRNDLALKQLWIAALYSRAHHLPVPTAGWLPSRVRVAMVWYRQREAEATVRDFEKAFQEALQAAYDAGLLDWVERFHRARGDARAEVLQEWVAR